MSKYPDKKPYSIRLRNKKEFFIFMMLNIYEIVYEEDMVVYTSSNYELIKDVCEAMNIAHRVGYFDAQRPSYQQIT